MDEFLSHEKRASSFDQLAPRTQVAEISCKKAVKKGITHYFSLLDDKKGLDRIGLDKKVCKKCSKSFDPFDEQGFQEHLDYHLALQLQKEINEGPPPPS